ncbi:MAG TPA: enoyl-CoA hydratase-related protein, partial [Burkholderiaceae bacterium]|nr:enoyl-CoA hydratase-related protein [Burkholderiaceae bacterium]
RFSAAYSRVGLSPDGGLTWHLMQTLPRQLVAQLLWTAEPVGAEQMQAWGLVNRVTDKGQALREAVQLARQVSQRAPNVLASTKELLNLWPARSLPQQLDAERDAFVDNLLHPNGAEGIDAFFEKREPRYR